MADISSRVKLFLHKKNHIILLTPAIILLLLLSIYPLMYSLNLSFSRWQLGTSPDTSEYVGFANYIWLFNNTQFWNSLGVTLKILFLSVGIEFLLGMGLALLFDSKLKGINKAVPIILLPIMLTPAVVGLIWRLLLNEQFGIINYYLTQLGIKPVNWLSSTSIAPMAIALVDVWQWTPFLFLIFFAGLKALPIDIYEAADVDGASYINKFLYITLPLLKVPIAIALIIRTTDFLKIFDQVYMITFGGPGNSTETLGLFAYKLAFINASLGRASATSYILLIISIIFGLSLLKFMKQEKQKQRSII